MQLLLNHFLRLRELKDTYVRGDEFFKGSNQKGTEINIFYTNLFYF